MLDTRSGSQEVIVVRSDGLLGFAWVSSITVLLLSVAALTGCKVDPKDVAIQSDTTARCDERCIAANDCHCDSSASGTAHASPPHRIDVLFHEELRRPPSADERDFWTIELSRRAEAQVRTYLRLIAQSIDEVFHRSPRRDELARFADLLDRGVPL